MRRYPVTRLIIAVGVGLLALFLTSAATAQASPTTVQIGNGGTSTSTPPAYGYVPIGGKNGEYEYVASSTFGGGSSVPSVFGRTGAVTAQSGDYTTNQVTEGSNLYFTNARAQAAISNSTPITYSGGVIGCQTASGSQSGCLSSADWTAFNSKGTGTVGSGFQGYLPFYNASGTALTATSTISLSQAGFIGIGTTAPRSRLDIQVSDFQAPYTGGVWLHTSDASTTIFGTYGLNPITIENGPSTTVHENFIQDGVGNMYIFHNNDGSLGNANVVGFGFSDTTNNGQGADYMLPGGGFAYQDAAFDIPGAMFEVDAEDVGLGFCELGTNDNSDCGASFSTNIFNDTAEVGAGSGQTGNSTLGVYGSQTVGIGYFDANAPTNGLLVEGKVGIGTTTPYSSLEVWGPDTGTASAFAVVNNASTTVFKVADNGAVVSGGTAPTIATGTGIGIGGSATVAGTENSQEIVIRTGSAPANSGVVATITLPTACPTNAVPTFSADNQKAAAQAGSGSIYMASSSNNAYTINSGAVGLTATTTFAWNVHVDCW